MSQKDRYPENAKFMHDDKIVHGTVQLEEDPAIKKKKARKNKVLS